MLGYFAVTIAGALFYADWKLGWDATKVYTGPACLAYFVLNGALTYWIWAVESGKVYVGVREGGQKVFFPFTRARPSRPVLTYVVKLSLTSSVTKHVPVYKLKIRYEAPQTHKRWVDDETIEGNFTDWFTLQGQLDRKALRRWLAGKIEVVGTADPAAKREWDEEIEADRVDEEVVSHGAMMSGAVAGTPTSESAKKRGRPRKS